MEGTETEDMGNYILIFMKIGCGVSIKIDFISRMIKFS